MAAHFLFTNIKEEVVEIDSDSEGETTDTNEDYSPAAKRIRVNNEGQTSRQNLIISDRTSEQINNLTTETHPSENRQTADITDHKVTTPVTLTDILPTLNKILRTLELQVSKQEDVGLQLQYLANKIEKQHLQIRSIESEVKNNKDVLVEIKESMRVNTEKAENLVKDEFNHFNDIHRNNTNVMKKEIIKSVRDYTGGALTIIRNDIKQLKDVNTQFTTDVISQLENADQLVLSNMAADRNLSYLVAQEKLKDDLMEKLDSLKETTREQTSTLKDIQNEFSTDGRINDMMRTHTWTLIDQIVSESQILRETIKYKRTERKSYTCDFFVDNFCEFISSGERQHSRLWFIDCSQNYFKGFARFKVDGKLDIMIAHGCAPRVVGQTVENGPRIKVKVKAIEVGKQDWELGNTEMETCEPNNKRRVDGWTVISGTSVACIQCQQLIDKGYVDNIGRIILRFEITVL